MRFCVSILGIVDTAALLVGQIGTVIVATANIKYSNNITYCEQFMRKVVKQLRVWRRLIIGGAGND